MIAGLLWLSSLTWHDVWGVALYQERALPSLLSPRCALLCAQTATSLSVHPLMGRWVACSVGLMWIELLWTLLWRFFWRCVCLFLSSTHLQMELLAQNNAVFNFWGRIKLNCGPKWDPHTLTSCALHTSTSIQHFHRPSLLSFWNYFLFLIL